MEAATIPLSFGLVDGRPVFMDIEQDRYFQLGQDEECAFLDALKLSEFAREPIEQGLAWINEDKVWKIGPASSPHPAKRELQGNPDQARLADILIVARLVLTARKAIRTRSIASILERVAAPGTDAFSSTTNCLGLAVRFRKVRRLIPIGGNCLGDSLALMCWLGRGEERATLVFGVKLDPFAAHCWVEREDIILNDHPERVERFTPVRIIECAPGSP